MPDISQIMGRVFIGNRQCIVDEVTLDMHNIKAAISLIHSPETNWSKPSFHDRVPHHIWVEALDSSTQELLRFLPRCCDFIEENLKAGVLVHCEMGVSRSATIVLAYLMRKGKVSGVGGALAYVSGERNINPSANFKEQLRVWEKCDYKLWEDEEEKYPKPAYREWLSEKRVERKKVRLTSNDSFRKITPGGFDPFAAYHYNKDPKNVLKLCLAQQPPSDFITERHFGVIRQVDKTPT